MDSSGAARPIAKNSPEGRRRCRNLAVPFVLSPSGPSLWSLRNGPESQLERLPASVARHLSRRALSGYFREREDQLQPAQTVRRQEAGGQTAKICLNRRAASGPTPGSWFPGLNLCGQLSLRRKRNVESLAH